MISIEFNKIELNVIEYYIVYIITFHMIDRERERERKRERQRDEERERE